MLLYFRTLGLLDEAAATNMISPSVGSSNANRSETRCDLHDSGGLDEDEGSLPTRPDAAQPDPQEPVTALEPEPPGLPLEHHQLMPKRDILKCEIPSIFHR